MYARVAIVSFCLWLTFGHQLIVMAGSGTSKKATASSSADESPEESDKKSTAQAKDEIELRINYVGASWKSVLDSLGEKTGKKVVMPEVPRGKYSRTDLKKYTLPQVLRILNEELRPQNFRIVDKGEFLIVLRDDSFRPEYERNEVKKAVSRSAEAPEQANIEPEKTLKDSYVRSASGEEDPAFSAVQTASVTDSDNAKYTHVELQHRRAVDIAKQIYTAYQPDAKLITKGLMGLPSFRVETPAKDSKPAVTFEIALDTESNELFIDGDAKSKADLTKLCRILDRADVAATNQKLMTVSPSVAPMAEELPLVVGELLKDPRRAQTIAMTQAQPQGDAPITAPPAAPAQAVDPSRQADPKTAADLNSILNRIRGNVKVESLPDSGMLVLEGNEQDINAVMEIIRSIEGMSAGMTPEIHLRHLSFVNSEALTELLNSVYTSVQSIDQRTSRNQVKVNVIPVVQPNSVIIVSPTVELDAVLQLIDQLDRPMEADSMIQLFQLKNATAAAAVGVIEDFYQTNVGMKSRARVSADYRTNLVIAQGSQRDLTEVAKILEGLDRDESHAINRIELIPLKYAVAQEIADFLNESIDEALNPKQLTNAGAATQNSARSIVLEFLSGSGQQAELIRSGVLSDLRISADIRSNSLAVIAPARTLPLIRSLVAALDRPADAAAVIKVFTLGFADATASADMLSQLFDATDAVSSTIPVQGARDSASSLIPIRFSVDIRTNSILAIGGEDALTQVEAILLKLDQSDSRQRTSKVVQLNNSPAELISEAINQFLETQRELAALDQDAISLTEQLQREVIVVPDPNGNNLLISATPQYMDEIMRIINELDKAPAQVIIQALLVEVALDNTDEFGIELGFQDSVLFDRSIIDSITTLTQTTTNQNIQTTTQNIVSQSGSPGYNFNNGNPLGNNLGPGGSPSTVGSQSLTNFGVGRANSELGFGGLVLSASSEQVSLLIRALQARRNTQILSRPQIRTVHNQIAQIQVGQNFPIVDGVNISQAGIANPNVSYDTAGIILDVTPRINPDGQIVMDVVAEKSNYTTTGGVPIFVDANTGNTITAPVKNITVARSTVSVTSGQTIVLGGMITEEDDTVQRKVPWLGDIPIINHLFRYDSVSTTRRELLIFLTPRVIGDDCENELIKEVEAGRLHFLVEDAEKAHGPLFGIPQEGANQMMEGVPLQNLEMMPDGTMSPAPALESEYIDRRLEESDVPSTIMPPGNLKLSPPNSTTNKPGSARL